MQSSRKTREPRTPVLYCAFDELPDFLTVKDVADFLRISLASAYTVTEAKDFPSLLFNCHRRVERSCFIDWLISKEVKNGQN